MAYAVLADVQGVMAKWTLDGSSTPTSTQATAIINAISEEIDAVLGGQGISVPVATPSEFVTYLKMLNVYGGAARILRSMFPDSAGPGETPAYAYWEAQYDQGLKALRGGHDIPSTAPTTSGAGVAATYLTRNPEEEEELGDLAESTSTHFRIGKEF